MNIISVKIHAINKYHYCNFCENDKEVYNKYVLVIEYTGKLNQEFENQYYVEDDKIKIYGCNEHIDELILLYKMINVHKTINCIMLYYVSDNYLNKNSYIINDAYDIINTLNEIHNQRENVSDIIEIIEYCLNSLESYDDKKKLITKLESNKICEDGRIHKFYDLVCDFVEELKFPIKFDTKLVETKMIKNYMLIMSDDIKELPQNELLPDVDEVIKKLIKLTMKSGIFEELLK
jgi:hypothetical protein